MGPDLLGLTGTAPAVAPGTLTAPTYAPNEAPAAKPPPGRLGIFAALWAFALPVVVWPSLLAPTFAPKYAVMLLAAGVGVVPLVRFARRGGLRWAARLAIAFLIVALVSALLSR
ncbi:MAG: hypothetical protein ACRD0B_13155, partial [Acidimicrobiales bacterium]